MTTHIDIQKMADVIAEKFCPTKIILFGSYARGDNANGSDVDLLVIMPTDERGPSRVAPIRTALWGFKTAIDVLVRTPEEFEEDKELYFTASHSANKEGIILFE